MQRCCHWRPTMPHQRLCPVRCVVALVKILALQLLPKLKGERARHADWKTGPRPRFARSSNTSILLELKLLNVALQNSRDCKACLQKSDWMSYDKNTCTGLHKLLESTKCNLWKGRFFHHSSVPFSWQTFKLPHQLFGSIPFGEATEMKAIVVGRTASYSNCYHRAKLFQFQIS